jgi:hypothetical protein
LQRLAPYSYAIGRLLSVARSAKQRDRQVFVLLYSPVASDSGSLRITCFNHGCNMVTASLPDAQHVLRLIAGISSRLGQGPYACPSCELTGLTEDDLHEHYPLYHVNETNVTVCCPICSVTCEPRRLPFPPHLYNRYRHVALLCAHPLYPIFRCSAPVRL